MGNSFVKILAGSNVLKPVIIVYKGFVLIKICNLNTLCLRDVHKLNHGSQ